MHSSPIRHLLEQRCKDLCDTLGVTQIYVAHILGRRRHFLAGYGQPEPSQPEQMLLSDHLAVFWHGSLSEQARETLKQDLQRLTGFLEKELVERQSPHEEERRDAHLPGEKTGSSN